MSLTVDHTATVGLAFTLDHIATFLTWDAGAPFGLEVSMAFDHDGLLEVAEVIRCHPREALYVLKPTASGAVSLTGAYAGRCEFDTIEAALGRVLGFES